MTPSTSIEFWTWKCCLFIGEFLECNNIFLKCIVTACTSSNICVNCKYLYYLYLWASYRIHYVGLPHFKEDTPCEHPTDKLLRSHVKSNFCQSNAILACEEIGLVLWDTGEFRLIFAFLLFGLNEVACPIFVTSHTAVIYPLSHLILPTSQF